MFLWVHPTSAPRGFTLFTIFISAGSRLPVAPLGTHQHIHTNAISRLAAAAHTSDDSQSSATAPARADEHAFKLSRAVLVTKLSRLELEQHRRPDLSAVQLERVIRERGTDYDSLLYHHHVHNTFLERVADCFSDAGVDVRIANR